MTGKITILTIDDEAAIRTSIHAFLEDYEYDILEAENGRVGIKIFKEKNPDLVLVDLRMPEMDGLEVLDTIKKIAPDTPVIVISGTGVISDAVEAIQRGAWNYILKPIQDMSLLLHVVESALDKVRLKQENIAYQKDLEQRNKELSDSFKKLQHAQNRMIQSEKMSALGGLVAGISHEINTPIGVIVTASSYLNFETTEIKKKLEEETLSKSDLTKFLDSAVTSSDLIMKNVNRASELISSFKQVAVDQTGAIKRHFNMCECIQNTLNSLHPEIKKHNITIDVSCPGKIALYSYPGSFYQILTNFITNSIFHAFPNKQKGTISISAKSDNKKLTIQYSDNGKGMSEEVLEKMYNPFFTTKRPLGGTGLGMHIVYNIVTQKLLGELHCESAPNKGTTFTITIPKKQLIDTDNASKKKE